MNNATKLTKNPNSFQSWSLYSDYTFIYFFLINLSH